jgi:hypothetical protein
MPGVPFLARRMWTLAVSSSICCQRRSTSSLTNEDQQAIAPAGDRASFGTARSASDWFRGSLVFLELLTEAWRGLATIVWSRHGRAVPHHRPNDLAC